MKLPVIALLLSVIALCANAQIPKQTVRGTVTDRETQMTLPGAIAIITGDSGKTYTAISDANGNFRIQNVPVGRHFLKIRLIGYNDYGIELIITSVKEVIVNADLEARVALIQEAVVEATKKNETNNEIAQVSARSFTIDETERYAGSRQDPARMASNFAGVQGSNDARNDIVIRGNSPAGLLWRIEGVDVINPNHFAVPGTTGSAISLLNGKTFGNSDFFTGAFPAEYGNATAGIFDIKLRNGNNENYEFTGQIGFLGTEILAEGPINKDKGSSYLFTYRYSTLRMFEAMNIKIGTDAVPTYQDGTFKLNFPTKKAGTFSVFAISGLSDVDIVVSNETEPTAEIYGDKNRDQYFGTGTAVGGISHSYQWSERTFSKITLSAQWTNAHAHHDLVYRDSSYQVDSLVNKLNYDFTDNKISLNAYINSRINSRNMIKAGIIFDQLYHNYSDSNYLENQYVWDVRENDMGSSFMIQPYLDYKFRFNDALTFTAGVHGFYASVNRNSQAAELRASVQYRIKNNQSLAYGFGMHSQLAPTYIYYALQYDAAGHAVMINKDIGLTKSIHNVISYRLAFKNNARLLIETYYQHLYNVPVEYAGTSVSLINQGATFTRFFPDSLQNAGTGTNYGIELTLEKYFSKNYFALFTVSVYNSTYKGNDGITRNTDYNGNFVTNMVAGREWKFKKLKNTVLLSSGKITWAGGPRYSPADTVASDYAGELVITDSLRNSLQFKNYFRVDLKLGFRIDAKKTSHEIAVDLVNVFNIQNVLGLAYYPTANPPLQEEYQLGFLPLFYYKIDF